MDVKFNQQYLDTKTDEELDVLVAQAMGLELRSMAGEGGWVDSEGALIHLQHDYHPTAKMNYALELIQLVAMEGNGLAINTSEPVTKQDLILIGGFPKVGEEPLPLLGFPIEDITDFGKFRKTWLRAIAVFFIMYKSSRQN